MYVCTGAHEGQRLEKAANMTIYYYFFSYSSHTEKYNYKYLHTIAQTSKLVTWQNKANIYTVQLEYQNTHREMSTLLVVVKSHLFIALVHYLSI